MVFFVKDYGSKVVPPKPLDKVGIHLFIRE